MFAQVAMSLEIFWRLGDAEDLSKSEGPFLKKDIILTYLFTIHISAELIQAFLMSLKSFSPIILGQSEGGV